MTLTTLNAGLRGSLLEVTGTVHGLRGPLAEVTWTIKLSLRRSDLDYSKRRS